MPGKKEREQKARFESELQRMKTAHDKAMKDKEEEISTLRALVLSQRDTISYQEQIIKLLYQRIPEEKA